MTEFESKFNEILNELKYNVLMNKRKEDDKFKPEILDFHSQNKIYNTQVDNLVDKYLDKNGVSITERNEIDLYLKNKKYSKLHVSIVNQYNELLHYNNDYVNYSYLSYDYDILRDPDPKRSAFAFTSPENYIKPSSIKQFLHYSKYKYILCLIKRLNSDLLPNL